MAKKLNNRGSKYIVLGKYDEAIYDLKEALEVTKMVVSTDVGTSEPSPCVHCPFHPFLQMLNDVEKADGLSSSTQRELGIRQLRAEKKIVIVTDNNKGASSSGLRQDKGFIYRHPFVVDPRCIDLDHYMGATLSFIIVFNIALAHHLKAIDLISSGTCKTDPIEILQQPLRLYELAYELHFQCKEEWLQQSRSLQQQQQRRASDNNARSLPQELCDEESHGAHTEHLCNLVNLRLMLLLTNNIGEIHKLAGSTGKYNKCLEHLLNAIMYMSLNFQGETVISTREKDGMFENLSPILGTNEIAEAA